MVTQDYRNLNRIMMRVDGLYHNHLNQCHWCAEFEDETSRRDHNTCLQGRMLRRLYRAISAANNAIHDRHGEGLEV